MKNDRKVLNLIKQYHPQGGLDKAAILVLNLLGIGHYLVRQHAERVALLAREVARQLKWDDKAVFFAGIFHDIGKLTVAPHLFDGREITAEEYAHVKQHAIAGFRALRDLYLMTALCAGLHHAMYQKGYGLTIADFPKGLSLRTIKKILEISTLVAICDDIDATLSRKTSLKDGTQAGLSLEGRLAQKFPDDTNIVRLALEVARAKQ